MRRWMVAWVGLLLASACAASRPIGGDATNDGGVGSRGAQAGSGAPQECVPTCAMLSFGFVGPAVEYFQIGSASPPDEPEQLVPVVETKGLRGELRLRVEYFEDERCQQSITTFVSLSIPEGVCCPIGEVGCSFEGPPGAWAPSSAKCAWPIAFDSSMVGSRHMELDPWGCPC